MSDVASPIDQSAVIRRWQGKRCRPVKHPAVWKLQECERSLLETWPPPEDIADSPEGIEAAIAQRDRYIDEELEAAGIPALVELIKAYADHPDLKAYGYSISYSDPRGRSDDP